MRPQPLIAVSDRQGEQLVTSRQKITTFLWYNDNAEEAVNDYLSIFKSSRMVSVARQGSAASGPRRKVMSMTFQLEGQKLMALNGGPQFRFTEAMLQMTRIDIERWKQAYEGE